MSDTDFNIYNIRLILTKRLIEVCIRHQTLCRNKSNIINIEVCIRHQTLCRNKSNIINIEVWSDTDFNIYNIRLIPT
jgi:hypothetical protein